MKNTRLELVVHMVIFLFSYTASAQNVENALRKDDNSSYFSAQINYFSDAVFMGRKDSVAEPYLLPSVKYHHKSGFYLEGSFSYPTKGNDNGIDLFLLSSGFEINFERAVVDLSVSKYFFNDDSYKVISDVEVDVAAYIIYDLDIVDLSLLAGSYFNDNGSSDFFMYSDLSHDLMILRNKLQISPTLGIYLGSQNFYVEYYKKKQTDHGNNNQTNTNTTILENDKFDLMAIEIGVPVWYNSESLTLYFLPAYVIPQNGAQVVVDDTSFEEDLEDVFYWMAGITYQF